MADERRPQSVCDYHISRTAQERQLDVAHERRCPVDVLGDVQRGGAGDVLPHHYVPHGDQQDSRATGRVIYTNPPLLFQMCLYSSQHRHGHKMTDGVRCEELPLPMIVQLQRGEHLPEEDLLWIFLQRKDHGGQEFGEHLPLLFLIAPQALLVVPFPVIMDSAFLVEGIGDGDSGHGHEVSPHLPCAVGAAQL